MRYSDEFRASAVVMLEAAGYPHTKGALMRVAGQLGVPAMTVSRWFRGTRNPPPNKMVSEKTLDLVAAIRSEIAAIVPELGLTRGDADYKTLVTALAILTDKLQLLEGKPTERTEQSVTIDDSRERLTHLVNRFAARSAANGHPEPIE
jgi:transposase-like protein